MNVADMLSTGARRFGNKPALIAPDRTLSFNELDQLSTRLALHLRRLGIAPGDRVSLWLENGWRWMVAYYGILRSGAVVNPCNIVLAQDEVDFIANDCGATAVIGARERVSGLRFPLVITDSMEEAGRGPNLEELLSIKVECSERSALSRSKLGDIATVAYTSGTTGRPKGAQLSHSTILFNTFGTALMHGRSSADIVVSALPCSHVYGNIVMNSAVLCGMTLVLFPRFDETDMLHAIETHRATMFEGVPTMYIRMLNFSQFSQFDLSSLRLCTVGGQTMPVSKMIEIEEKFGCRIIELWGMTEIGGLGITHPHDGPERLGSIGVALPLTEAKVTAMDDPYEELPRDEIGELLVRGPLVMQGYLGNQTATEATIEADGWLHTGDLVRQDADGYFYVVDRIKEVILSGGYNVYPAEVERVIAEHPGVAMVAVAAIDDDLKGQVAKAFVVRKSSSSCTEQEIIEHCKVHLASYKVPRAVCFLEDLPKTSTGKILRRALT